ncbi:MAG: hypothetical protein JRI23_22740 [Deltaproteobacteria bacterium]|jgi:hypothetical protein|nr:hypothetical protein [Deltaproteobacteria bacterium]MBW2534786.1 hypothetical protein [Deltaproteobacteria bacterium]
MSSRLLTAIAVSIALGTAALAAGACSKKPSESDVVTDKPPPAPGMPPGWEMQTDDVIPPAQFPAIESKLQGKLKALRNTVYDANDHRVQLNVIQAASTIDADSIERSLGKMKAKWAFRRKGDVIYEFVGDDAASDEIRKACASMEP